MSSDPGPYSSSRPKASNELEDVPLSKPPVIPKYSSQDYRDGRPVNISSETDGINVAASTAQNEYAQNRPSATVKATTFSRKKIEDASVDAKNLDAQPKAESKKSVIAAICGNIGVGIVKFIAAAISGSTAMISEGIHSIVDSGNGLLILLGLHQAKREPDVHHPFGYGKELYFWTLVVAVLIFALGGMISIFEGVRAIRDIVPGQAMGDPTVSYVVIVLAAIIEGTSLSIAVRQFNLARGTMGPLEFIKNAKDPSMYTVVLEDSAAELGLIFAFLGISLSHALNCPYLDGGASILIGLLLCCVSGVLLRETKGLLIGEGLTHDEAEEIQQMVESNPNVLTCGRILSMYMGPHDLLITLDATFKHECSSDEVLASIDEIEIQIVQRFPETTRVFIEVESLKQTRIDRAYFESMDDE